MMTLKIVNWVTVPPKIKNPRAATEPNASSPISRYSNLLRTLSYFNFSDIQTSPTDEIHNLRKIGYTKTSTFSLG